MVLPLCGIHGLLLSIHGLLPSMYWALTGNTWDLTEHTWALTGHTWSEADEKLVTMLQPSWCVCVCVCVCGHLCRMSPTLAFPSTHSIPCRSSRVANRSCANLIDGHRQGCFPCSAYGFCMHTQLTQTRVGECCGEDRRGHYLVRIC